MKRFKKVLSMLLVLCMTAAMMTGCGNGDKGTTNNETNNATTNTGSENAGTTNPSTDDTK